MDEKITRFIKKQTCASIACVDESGHSYSFSCFYVFNPEEVLLYFKSSSSSRHAGIITVNPTISGTIQPDKLIVLMVQGIQFEGEILPAGDPFSKHAAAKYYKRHPAALAIPGEIWTIKINHIKMTDSTIGFGKKITWSRSAMQFPA